MDTAQVAAPQPSSEAGLAGLRLLIVDPNATQRALLTEYATAWRMRVEAVDSGHAALSALRAGASQGRPFHVALLDRSATGVACADLKDEIVADPALIAGPALMIDLAEPHENRQDPDADACPYVSKPVHLEDLRRCLRMAAGLDEAETRLADRGAEARAAAEPAAGCLLVAETTW